MENKILPMTGPNEYGPHAVHEGRSIQPGARERGGESPPVKVRFGNLLPLGSK